MKSAFHILLTSPLHNNAKRRLPHAKNSKSLTTVSLMIKKTSSKKSSTMVQLSLSSQFTEISSSTRRVSIKFIQETKDSPQVKLSNLSDGTLETDNPVGLLKTVGEKIGEKTELRNFLFNFRCVLVNQDELQIERFAIAPALNVETIDGEKTLEENAETLEENEAEHQ